MFLDFEKAFDSIDHTFLKIKKNLNTLSLTLAAIFEAGSKRFTGMPKFVSPAMHISRSSSKWNADPKRDVLYRRISLT